MSTSPRFFSVFGNWYKTSKSSADIDLEAQPVTGTHAPESTHPASEPVHLIGAPTRTPEQNVITTDPLDDFFGVNRPRATHESRHDLYIAPSRASAVMDAETPPPYADATELPAYSSTPVEPVTLAMYLFKFGFLFPPFWLLGAIILLSPLDIPADFEPTKSEAERQELVRIIRDVEIMWAKRSAWSLLIFIIAFGVIAGVVVAVMKS